VRAVVNEYSFSVTVVCGTSWPRIFIHSFVFINCQCTVFIRRLHTLKPQMNVANGSLKSATH
jgi:hypothetical protein